MDDLNLVAVSQNRRRPRGAAHDALIEFDRDLLRFQVQTRDQLRKREVRCDFASFAIDLNAQEFFGDLTRPDGLRGAVQPSHL
jgi:hypothetical protein